MLLLVITTLSSLTASLVLGGTSCAFDPHCALGRFDKLQRQHGYLKSGKSPGKRAGPVIEDSPYIPVSLESSSDVDRQIENLFKKKRALFIIKRLLASTQQQRSNVQPSSKRACSFGMGNHCLTEKLDKSAQQYWYLKSYESPGKRRRRDAQVLNDADNSR